MLETHASCWIDGVRGYAVVLAILVGAVWDMVFNPGLRHQAGSEA